MSTSLRAIASETVAIVAANGYQSPDGNWVDLKQQLATARNGTRLYLPDQAIPTSGPQDPARMPVVEVTNESTLAAAQRIGQPAAALIFASARNPGGGFLTGARAQEEDVSRCSALYECLIQVPQFYDYHRAHRDLRYSDRIIYSPAVPVFRSDHYKLLAQPYQLSMFTAAAPNLSAIRRNQPEALNDIPGCFASRCGRLLRVAAANAERTLILGAWGCGVFGNDPAVVAQAFSTALRENQAFDRIVFAVLDRSPEATNFRSFARVIRSTFPDTVVQDS